MLFSFFFWLLRARCCRGYLGVHRPCFLRDAVPDAYYQRLSSLHDHLPSFHLIPRPHPGPPSNRSCNFVPASIALTVVVVIFADELADQWREWRHVAPDAPGSWPRTGVGLSIVFVWDCKRHHLQNSADVRLAKPHLPVAGAAFVVA